MQFHKLISFVFHPIIIPITSSLLYFILIPNHIPKGVSYRVLGFIFLITYIIPIVLLFVLRKVKLIEDYHLVSIQERKFPIVFFTILSFLLGNLLLKTGVVNLLAYSFFGSSLALGIVYSLFYINIKTSLHTLAIAGLIGLIMVISITYEFNLLLLLIFLFILIGIVATSRLQLKAHTLPEVVIGFFVGILTQLTMYYFYII